MEAINGEINLQGNNSPQDSSVHINGEMNGSTDLEIFKTQKTKIISCDETSDNNLDSINNTDLNKISDSETKENVVKVPKSASEVPSITETEKMEVDEVEKSHHEQDIKSDNKTGDDTEKENDEPEPLKTNEKESKSTPMDVEEVPTSINTEDSPSTNVEDSSAHVDNKKKNKSEIESENVIDKKNVSESTDSKEHTDTIQDSIVIESSQEETVKSNENGEDRTCSSPDIEEINNETKKYKNEENSEKLENTPSKSKKRKNIIPANITPRRSSRNLSKIQKSYIEKEEKDEDIDQDEDDDEIEEIPAEDPLAVPTSIPEKERDNLKSVQRSSRNKTTIVVNDTKRLVEIAAGTKNVKGGKKEPTLVIIDTNSILSGRGPVPVSSASVNSPNSSFSVLPVSLPSQGMYSTPRNSSLQVTPAPKPQPQILPSLTDDMYVVEAPSFIVPYVYEKPPLKPLKEFIAKLGEEIKKMELEEEKQLKKEEEERKEKEEKEKEENKESENSKEEQDTSKDEKEEKDKGKISPINEENNEKEKKESEKSSESDKNENISDDEDEQKTEKNKNSENDKENSKSENSTENKEKDKDEGGEKIGNYFENPLGKFFIQIGTSLVQEHVQTDLLRSQKRKRDREIAKGMAVTDFPINSLIKNLELSKENNEPYHLEQKKCEFCNFKTESSLVMAQHLETPHMRNYVYRCNFCPLEVRSPHDILFHMEAEHNVRGRLERAPAYHQCPSCLFEDNQKGKLTRHLLSCTKKFKPERNLEPPLDWEPPAKIPRLARNRPPTGALGSTAYQALAVSGKPQPQMPLLPKLVPSPQTSIPGLLARGRGRPPMHSRIMADPKLVNRTMPSTQLKQQSFETSGMIYRPTNSSNQVLLPTTYQISGNQIYQVVGGQGPMMPVPLVSGVPKLTLVPQPASPAPTPVVLVPIGAANNSITIQSTTSNNNNNKSNPAAKLLQQPSISITPLPRQPAGIVSQPSGSNKPPGSSNKTTFVICEICDGYIKDLEQLRNHMQWIHKVKIHPKMIYNRPPLNCQKCQFRFFTDQGLERHLLGSHGLVTSSMQEAANKGKDGGRCPVCGRVYQWKLLNHVARDHNMTLKPAHLSYKCTVCTATFGMYKQFENHVYSAHSIVAKRVMDKKSPPMSGSRNPSETLLKPLKINDEITIIPQPARPRPTPTSRSGSSPGSKPNSLDDSPAKSADSATRESREESLSEVKARLRRRKSLEISQVDAPEESPVENVTEGQL